MRRASFLAATIAVLTIAWPFMPPATAFSCPKTEVRVEPGRAHAGKTITIKGYGWFRGPCDASYEGPEKRIEVSLVQGNRSWGLGTARASTKSGAFYLGFRMTARVPTDAPPGKAYIVATGQTKSARTEFRVLESRLPVTGVPGSSLRVVGLALLTLASVALVAARRHG